MNAIYTEPIYNPIITYDFACWHSGREIKLLVVVQCKTRERESEYARDNRRDICLTQTAYTCIHQRGMCGVFPCSKASLWSHTKAGANTVRHAKKNVTVLKFVTLPFTLAFELVCFGNNKIVGLIIPTRQRAATL